MNWLPTYHMGVMCVLCKTEAVGICIFASAPASCGPFTECTVRLQVELQNNLARTGLQRSLSRHKNAV